MPGDFFNRVASFTERPTAGKRGWHLGMYSKFIKALVWVDLRDVRGTHL